MVNRILRVAVCGCGSIGHRHIAMIGQNPDMELVAVADVRPADQCLPPSGVPFFPSLEEMLCEVPDVDLVCVCTPNGLHARQAIMVLERDVNVLLEKPLALSTADSLALRKAEERSKGRLFSVFQNRYTPTSVWLHDIVSGGRLGTLASVVVNCFWNRDQRYYKPGGWHGTMDLDGGTLFTQFSHFVDLLLWVVGHVEITAAQTADFAHHELTDFEDSGNFLFRVKNGGALGSFTYSTVTAIENFECSLTLIGTLGTIKIGGAYMNELQYCNVPGVEVPTFAAAPAPNDYGGYKGSAANHHYVFNALADNMLRGGAAVAGWQEGHDVVALIEDFYRRAGKDFPAATKLAYRP